MHTKSAKLQSRLQTILCLNMQLRTYAPNYKYANLWKAEIHSDSPRCAIDLHQPLKFLRCRQCDFAIMNTDPMLSLLENNFSIDTAQVDTSFCAIETQVQVRKRAPKRRRENDTNLPASTSGLSQRGPNWNENDSILLIKAYKYSEEKKKCKTTLRPCQLTESIWIEGHYSEQNVQTFSQFCPRAKSIQEVCRNAVARNGD